MPLKLLLRRTAQALIAGYALAAALLTVLRLLRLSGWWWLDLANTFAPYWHLPLVLTLPLTLLVFRPQRKRRSPRWSLWLQIALAGIGLYWFALPPFSRPAEPPPRADFSVITYNVQGGNRELDTAVDWLLAAAADVIVLQETARGADHRLARLDDAYAYEARIDGSVRIFSRYAILEQEFVVIEHNPGRRALRVVLAHGERELAVYAVHLTLPQAVVRRSSQLLPQIGFDFVRQYDETRRNAQIRSLLKVLQRERLPYIVAGDFNTSAASLIYDEMRALMNDAWHTAGRGSGHTWPIAERIGLPRLIPPMLRIDYLWHSAALQATAAAVGPPIGSDHLPLIAGFAFRPPTGALG